MNTLERRRKELRWSRKEMAQKIGVAENTLYNWEVGSRQPKLSQLAKIIEEYEMTTDMLLEWIQEVKK